jgi:hypothetical protein
MRSASRAVAGFAMLWMAACGPNSVAAQTPARSAVPELAADLRLRLCVRVVCLLFLELFVDWAVKASMADDFSVLNGLAQAGGGFGRNSTISAWRWHAEDSSGSYSPGT